jgi:hypothetical protein
MDKNKVIELILKREKHYIQVTEQIFTIFNRELKQGIENALFDGQAIELYVNDIGIVPQNFRFVRVEGKLAKYDIGESLEIDETKSVDITLENFWDFADAFTIIIPVSLLDKPETEKIEEYLKLVKENEGNIPPSILESNKIESNNDKEFVQVERELDDIQKMALKSLKSKSVH